MNSFRDYQCPLNKQGSQKLQMMEAGIKLNALVQVWLWRLHCVDIGVVAWKHNEVFLSRPFLCGFCAAEALEKLNLAGDGAANCSHIIEADCLEQCGRREKK